MSGPYRVKASFDTQTMDGLLARASAGLAEAGISGSYTYDYLTVVDELCCNVLEHSQASYVEIDIQAMPEIVRIIVRDDGQAFDPTAREGILPDGLLKVPTLRRLGLYMVGQLSERCHYCRLDDGRNELTVEIKKHPA